MRFGWAVTIIVSLLATPAWAEPLQRVDIPPSRQRGLDMILVDPDAMPAEPELARQRPEAEIFDGADAPPAGPVHPIHSELSEQLARYRERWSVLPQLFVPSQERAIAGAPDPRIAVLRQRLGLAKAGGNDKAVRAALTAYQAAHGLPRDGKPNAETIASLNRGAAHYEALIRLNLERARRLPGANFTDRYVLVDAGAARLWLYEDGRPVDSMKVVVGAPATETPMLAAMMRYSIANPYWNVPPELVRNLIAKNVLAQGLTYLSDRGYQVLDGWTDAAALVDPSTVNWAAVAEGTQELRVRQQPGGANSMGKIKFMMPNEYGIYLHDTPNRAPFDKEERWISNGCVRLEDAPRFARWLHGEMPEVAADAGELRVDLAKPVPVYLTYFTVGTEAGGLTFRKDPYDRDATLLARFGGNDSKMIDPDAAFRAEMGL